MTEDCWVCGDPIDDDDRCDHGRELCASHLSSCPECRQDFMDDASADRWRLM